MLITIIIIIIVIIVNKDRGKKEIICHLVLLLMSLMKIIIAIKMKVKRWFLRQEWVVKIIIVPNFLKFQNESLELYIFNYLYK